MKNRSFIGFITIFTSLFCIYYLSFTVASFRVQEKAKKYATDDATGNVDFSKQQDYLSEAWDKPVYKFLGFSYTYEELKEKELVLGLDLQGGMHVTLEVSPVDLIRSLAGQNVSEALLEALSSAIIQQRELPNENFTKLFYTEYKRISPASSLADVFATAANSKKIRYDSKDKDIIKVIDYEIESAISRSFEVIGARIDKFGTSQPSMQHLKGTNRIQIELPGVSNHERVRKMLQGVAQLKFWEVYTIEELKNQLEKIETLLVQEANVNFGVGPSNGRSEQSSPLFSLLKGNGFTYSAKDAPIIQLILEREDVKGMLPSNLKWCWDAKTKKSKNNSEEFISVYPIKQGKNGEAALEGDMISDAYAAYDGGKPTVSMQMNSNGSRIWRKVTSSNIGKQIAVTLDDCVYSAPVVNTEIPNGSSQITGNFTIEEAQDLASILKAGSLPVPVKIIEEAIVGPSVGEEAQNQGLLSMVMALAAIVIFMVAYYARAGAIANAALLFNLLFIIGILAQLGAALTIPGIAGIVLTLGMAVDANVLIFERVRDEISLGKHLRDAISLGYQKASSSILDSNITTFLVGVILYLLGQGPIRGFATTLMLGIVCSFFSSVFITRYIISHMIERQNPIKISFSFSWTRDLFKGMKFDFVKNRLKAYAFSASIILLGFGCIVKQGGLNLGVDFTGGRSFIVRFGSSMDISQMRISLEESFEGKSVEIKTYGSSDVFKITTSYMMNDHDDSIETQVKNKLVEAIESSSEMKYKENNERLTESDFAIVSTSKVGSTIANDVKSSALRSILLSLLMIFLYILVRFAKWQFGLAAVIALVHDTLMVFAAFGIARALGFTLEIDQVFIASVLTIIGYSINDTVVVFDRVREMLKVSKISLYETVNKSVNETLSRTIITSFTTLIAVLILFVFGGQVLKGFSFAMLIGVLFGTYSSIFIAMPLVADLSKGGAEPSK